MIHYDKPEATNKRDPFFQTLFDYKPKLDIKTTDRPKTWWSEVFIPWGTDFDEIAQKIKVPVYNIDLETFKPKADQNENLELINKIKLTIDQLQEYFDLCTWYVNHYKNESASYNRVSSFGKLAQDNLVTLKNKLANEIKDLTSAKLNLEQQIPLLNTNLIQPKSATQATTLPDKYVRVILDKNQRDNPLLGVVTTGKHLHLVIYDKSKNPQQIYIDLRTGGELLHPESKFEQLKVTAAETISVPKINDRVGVLTPPIKKELLEKELADEEIKKNSASITLDCTINHALDFEAMYKFAHSILSTYKVENDPDKSKTIYPYNVYTDNCAHLVLEVLKAGGIEQIATNSNIPIPTKVITPNTVFELWRAVNVQLNNKYLEKVGLLGSSTTNQEKLGISVTSMLSHINLLSNDFSYFYSNLLDEKEIKLPELAQIKINIKDYKKADETNLINLIQTILYGIMKQLEICKPEEADNHRNYLLKFIEIINQKLMTDETKSNNLQAVETILNKNKTALQLSDVQETFDESFVMQLRADFSVGIKGDTLKTAIINGSNDDLIKKQVENLKDVDLLLIANGKSLSAEATQHAYKNQNETIKVTAEISSEDDSSQEQTKPNSALKTVINSTLTQNQNFAVLNKTNTLLKLCLNAIDTDKTSIQAKSPTTIINEKKVNTKNAIIKLRKASREETNEELKPLYPKLISPWREMNAQIYVASNFTFPIL